MTAAPRPRIAAMSPEHTDQVLVLNLSNISTSRRSFGPLLAETDFQ
jgi:hypothetical protein